jgi:hypothetical protein
MKSKAPEQVLNAFGAALEKAGYQAESQVALQRKVELFRRAKRDGFGRLC